MVLGAIERGGDVRMKVSKRKSADSATLRAFMGAVIADDADWIMTDEAPVYRGIDHDRGIPHATVDHKAKEYVIGMAHTNTVEGVWSLFKRSIVGSYHQLSAKHLQAYLDEMAFRFNNRENPYLFRETMLRLIEADAMPYQALVAG